ncbi:DUF554 domain-containing protein [Alkalihalobacillus sp. AL-G]|uniref:DUF554 domain-containing protein n=1 Tax=Alkalihalobacillus sp. AL-G TaxID=2926399 RepID=UPI00272D2575|nr:DUF554 domain-containing protein [Alkalihalobacillus sp. AL-G]WLD93383.1 DUF554 domain-containing protein [Alkalihalobacillus sp. AL-G]
MVLLGTIVNGVAIAVGTLLGLFFTRIPENTKTIVMQAMGLTVVVLGIDMGLQSEHILIVIISLAIGGVWGEAWRLDDRLNQLGAWIEVKAGASEGSVAKAFVTATLVFVIGALSVVGALDSGLRHDHQILYTKSLIDGFIAMIFATTLGFGVIFSAIPVILYQGTIALLATQVQILFSPEQLEVLITELTATGGILIFAIGLNLLKIMSIKVVNLLPSLFITGILVYALQYKEMLLSYLPWL